MSEPGSCLVCGALLPERKQKICSLACRKEWKRRYLRGYRRQWVEKRREANREERERRPQEPPGACLICGAPLPPRRKTYCSDACGRFGNSKKNQEWRGKVQAGEHQPRGRQGGRGHRGARTEETEQRRCLKCDALFPSRGPENRLCSRCRKDNHSWLSHGGSEGHIYAAALWSDIG